MSQAQNTRPKIVETVVEPTVKLRDVKIGRCCEILGDTTLEYSELGDFSYLGSDAWFPIQRLVDFAPSQHRSGSAPQTTRIAAPAPKCSVISRCIRRMDSLLVGIPHSINCDEAVDAGSMLTCETPTTGRSPNSYAWTASSERWTPSDWNAGRDQIRTPDAIRSEHLDGIVRIRSYWESPNCMSAKRSYD
jgi:hypothetical protein